MKKIFILEDSSYRIDWFKKTFEKDFELSIYSNIDDAINNYDFSFDLMFLDHDLVDGFTTSEKHNSGSEFCRFLAICGNVNTPVIIHSHNTPGAEYMYDSLRRFKKVDYIPFCKLVFMVDKNEIQFD